MKKTGKQVIEPSTMTAIADSKPKALNEAQNMRSILTSQRGESPMAQQAKKPSSEESLVIPDLTA